MRPMHFHTDKPCTHLGVDLMMTMHWSHHLRKVPAVEYLLEGRQPPSSPFAGSRAFGSSSKGKRPYITYSFPLCPNIANDTTDIDSLMVRTVKWLIKLPGNTPNAIVFERLAQGKGRYLPFPCGWYPLAESQQRHPRNR